MVSINELIKDSKVLISESEMVSKKLLVSSAHLDQDSKAINYLTQPSNTGMNAANQVHQSSVKIEHSVHFIKQLTNQLEAFINERHQ